MTEEQLQQIISILDGPIPGPKATQKEIHDQSVKYHKCAGSLLDEVKSLRRQQKIIVQSVRDCIAESINAYDCDDIEELFEFNCKMASELGPWLNHEAEEEA